MTDNPAKEFANRGKAAVQENLPVDGPAEWDLSSLQVNVSQKLQAQASSTAKQASNKVGTGHTGDELSFCACSVALVKLAHNMVTVIVLSPLCLHLLQCSNRTCMQYRGRGNASAWLSRVAIAGSLVTLRARPSALWRASRTRPSSQPRRRAL